MMPKKVKQVTGILLTVVLAGSSSGMVQAAQTIAATETAADAAVVTTYEDTSGTWGDNLTWSYDEDTDTLTISGAGEMSAGTDVSEYPWYAYETDVVEIVIEDEVTSIADDAFYCFWVESVTIGSAVTSIGDRAFYACEYMEDLALPESLISIGEQAFYNCDYLEEITLPESLTDIGEQAFEGCTGITEIVIPDSVTYIGARAFYGIALTSLTLGSAVEQVGKYAFYGADLTSITVPDSVTYIGAYAFAGDESLLTVTVGSGLETLGYGAFAEDPALETIAVSSDNPYMCVDEGVLYGDEMTELIFCPMGADLTEYTVPDGVESIREQAFYSCTSLKSIVIGDDVTQIGDEAFCDCTGLESVVFGTSLERIGNNAFTGTAFTTMELPDSVTSIGDYAFSYSGLTGEVEIGGNVSDIGKAVFTCADGLQVITVDSENESYAGADGVLYDAAMTTLLQYPSGKTSTSFAVPDQVVTVGDRSFAGNDYLGEVTMGAHVSSVGYYALSYCGALETVTFSGLTAYVNYAVFAYSSGLEAVYFQGDAVSGNTIADTDASYVSEFAHLGYLFTGNGDVTVYYPDGNETWTEEYISLTESNMLSSDTTLTWETWEVSAEEAPAVSDCDISLSETEYVYDGSEKIPAVTVMNGTATLQEGVNYTLSYEDNVDAGTATVTITGTGSYTGSVSETYTIAKSEQSIAASLTAANVQAGKTVSVLAGGYGSLSYSSSDTSVAAVDSDGTVTGVADGEALITVTADGNDNYESASTQLTLTVGDEAAAVDLGTLAYSYANDAASLGYDASYRIPPERYQMFYSDTMASYYYDISDVWTGSGYGFASTAGMFNVSGSTLSVEDFSSAASAVSGLALTDEDENTGLTVQQLLEALQVSQFALSIQNSCNVYRDDLDAIAALAENVVNGGYPPIITVRSSAVSGHAVVGYALEEVSSTETRLYVYDSDYPDTEKYITLTKDSAGDYTDWSYEDYTYSISCIPYVYYQSVWEGRLTDLSSDTNSLAVSADSFEILDADGEVLASMTDGVFTSTDEEIRLCETEDTGTAANIVYLPKDTYTIVNTTGSNTFELTMTGVDQRAEIVTEADTVEILVDDERLTSLVTVDADCSESYEITFTTDQDGVPEDMETVTFEGSCELEPVTVGISNGELIEEGYYGSSVRVDGIYEGLIGAETVEVSYIRALSSVRVNKGGLTTVSLVSTSSNSEALALQEGIDYILVYSGYNRAGTATVTAYGINAYSGAVSVAYEVTDCSKHVYDDGVVTKEPTLHTDGVRTYTCIYCGETLTETIAMFGEEEEEETADGDSDTSDDTEEETDTSSGTEDDSASSGTEDDSASSGTGNDSSTSSGTGNDSSASSGTGNNSSASSGTGNDTASSSGTTSGKVTVSKPGKVTLKSVKSTKKKTLTVKWKKQSGSVKYQVSYRIKGKKKWKTVKVSGTSKKLKKLKSGKKYQVRVRAYKTVSGKTYYGKWSKTKAAKVK